MRKKISIFAGFALSIFLIYFAVRRVDFRSVLATYGKVAVWQIAALALLAVCDLFIRGLRWKLLIAPCRNAGVFTMTKLETIGLALNNVLPLRLGEIARAAIGAPLVNVPFFTLIATIVVERVLDTFSMAVIFLIAIQLGGGISWIKDYSGVIWMLLGGVAAGLGLLIFLDELLVHSKSFSGALDRFPRFGRFVRQIATGAEALRNFKLAVPIICLGLALWLLNAFEFYLAARSLHLNPALSYLNSVIVWGVGAIAVSLPAMPGYFGTWDIAIQRAVSAWGIDPATGLAYAAYIHITLYIVMTSLGIIFLYQTGNSLGGVWKNMGGKKSENAAAGGCSKT